MDDAVGAVFGSAVTCVHVWAVFGIYRYDTGIWPFFDSFWTGMVYWYAKVVWDQFDFFPLGGVNMSSKPLSATGVPPTTPSGLAQLGPSLRTRSPCHTAVQKLPVTPYSVRRSRCTSLRNG